MLIYTVVFHLKLIEGLKNEKAPLETAMALETNFKLSKLMSLSSKNHQKVQATSIKIDNNPLYQLEKS